jgi:very-short-patch-repair endonuclease
VETMTEPAWLSMLREQGGVARQTALLARRTSKRELKDAVESGALLRIRRSWLALPDADPLLIAAARAGVTLGCITRAERLGLWVHGVSTKPHVAAPPCAGGVRIETDDNDVPKATVHWFAPVVPRVPHALEDGIENALVSIALCQPFEAALATWESAFRKGLADRAVLARLKLPKIARELLSESTPYADSGLETIVPRRLRWLRVRIVPQAWLHGHRVDFLLGERLVLQIDGGHHVGPQRDSDNRHDAELALRGFHVIRVGFHQIMNDWPSVQHLIMTAVAQGLHLAR